MLYLTYHGHSCFSLEDGKYHIIIDPYLNGNPQAEVKPSDVSPTHILLSHGHGDHLGDALEIALRTQALIIAPSELAAYCSMKGARVHKMYHGGGFGFDFGKVRLTPAWHGSSVMEGDQIIYTGNPCGFIIEMQGLKIYHAGDTGIFGDMQLLGQMHHLDAALLPIGGNFVMDPEEALAAAKMLQADLTVPMHYNTFPVIRQDPASYVKSLQEAGLKGLVMNPGQKLSLS